MSKKIIHIIVFLVYCNVSFGQGSWTRKVDFGGGARWETVGFSIGGKGYFAHGSYQRDVWEYDPVLDVWEEKSSLPYPPVDVLTETTSFVIGSKAYIQCSVDSLPFWSYDAIADQWAPISDVGYRLSDGSAFSIGGKGYMCSGWDGQSCRNELWEYNPQTDSWVQKASMPLCRPAAVAFTIGEVAYVGTGVASGTGITGTKEFWKYEPAFDTWTPIADFGGIGRREAVAFVINNKGYVGLGGTNEGGIQRFSDFWEYDPLVDTWTQVADFPGAPRFTAGSFSIGSMGYVGTGDDPALEDFWEFNPRSSVDGIADRFGTDLFSLSPNPTDGAVRIKLADIGQSYLLKVYNTIGGLLYSKKLGLSKQFEFDLPETKGIYLVQITRTDGAFETIKVIRK